MSELLSRAGIFVLDKSIRAAIATYSFADRLTAYPVPKVEDVTLFDEGIHEPLKGFKKISIGWLSGYYSLVKEEDLQDPDGVYAQLCKRTQGGLFFRMVDALKGGRNG